MKKITIYTTPTCIWCRAAKAYFDKNGIKYEEKDVFFNEAARHELVQKSGQLGVPVIDIDGNIVIGFDQPAIKKLLL